MSNTRQNFRSFIWHAVFSSLAINFMDVDTIMPAMLIKAGGTSIHLGILTMIVIGFTRMFQLIFATYVNNKRRKKTELLWGINLRIFSLLGLAYLFYAFNNLPGNWLIFGIFGWVALFSISGAYATVSYTDLLGKSVENESRKKFFTWQQTLASFGILLSALVVREILKRMDYPLNYGLIFLIASLLLLIASLGFWQIKEKDSITQNKQTFLSFFRSIPSEINRNANLKYYLIILNILGIGLTLLPFLIMYAQQNFALTDEKVGNFLIFRVLGMILATLFIFRFSRKREYKSVLYLAAIMMAVVPVISLLLVGNPLLYQMIFILAGIFIATSKIGFSGILLEISDENNRALYTGISGAGNLMTVVFPLVAGFLFSWLGYTIIFLLVAALMLFSLFFIRKLDCGNG